MTDYILIAAIVLLPIVPAFLLFKFLRSTDGKAEGAFGGLKFSFGGAFAGYIVVMVFIANFSSKPTTMHIHGTLQFPDGERPPVVTCDVHPPKFNADGPHDFELDMDNGRMPVLLFSADGYDPVHVDLNTVVTKKEKGGIQIKDPVVFKKSPPYNPPTQVAEGGKP
jgi:hypothetical protein